MNFRRRETRTFTNPILIGALTVLVTIVAVTLAYNANNGLPFVPRYRLHVQIADASELTHGGEVHVGGALVGNVASVDPQRDGAGKPIAVLNLSLIKSIEPLPADSTFRVRLKGAIGLKYLAITPGISKRTLPNGATVPLSQSSAAVDLDQVLSMYDPPTRTGVAGATAGFAEGLAGRGSDINDAIGAFVPLVNDLGPVMQNLASRKTDFAGFFHGLEQFSAAVAPVSQQQADLYVNLDATFRPLAQIALPYLQQWIQQTPPTFSAVIAQSPQIEPFVLDTKALFGELRPGFATLPQSAPVLADAEAAGTHNLPGTAGLDQRLLSLARHLDAYGQTPAVQQGLARLTLTAQSLRSPLAFLTPAQSTCNYITLFLRNFASTLADPVATGTRLRFRLVAIDDLLGGESNPSHQPYTTPDTSQLDSHGPVHVDPYPNTDSPGQTPECSAANEPYSGKAAVIGNPAGNVGLKTEPTSRKVGQ